MPSFKKSKPVGFESGNVLIIFGPDDLREAQTLCPCFAFTFKEEHADELILMLNTALIWVKTSRM